jgi:hypothetical protein
LVQAVSQKVGVLWDDLQEPIIHPNKTKHAGMISILIFIGLNEAKITIEV